MKTLVPKWMTRAAVAGLAAVLIAAPAVAEDEGVVRIGASAVATQTGSEGEARVVARGQSSSDEAQSKKSELLRLLSAHDDHPQAPCDPCCPAGGDACCPAGGDACYPVGGDACCPIYGNSCPGGCAAGCSTNGHGGWLGGGGGSLFGRGGGFGDSGGCALCGACNGAGCQWCNHSGYVCGDFGDGYGLGGGLRSGRHGFHGDACQCEHCRDGALVNQNCVGRFLARQCAIHNARKRANNERLNAYLHCRFGYFIHDGCGGVGCPPFGHYSIVYADNPGHFDGRDGQVYAAQGVGGPVSVPLAPNVRHAYNYGWGIPSSRLTPVGNLPY